MKNMKSTQSMKIMDAIRQRQLCISDSSSAGESNRLEGAALSDYGNSPILEVNECF